MTSTPRSSSLSKVSKVTCEKQLWPVPAVVVTEMAIVFVVHVSRAATIVRLAFPRFKMEACFNIQTKFCQSSAVTLVICHVSYPRLHRVLPPHTATAPTITANALTTSPFLLFCRLCSTPYHLPPSLLTLTNCPSHCFTPCLLPSLFPSFPSSFLLYLI